MLSELYPTELTQGVTPRVGLEPTTPNKFRYVANYTTRYWRSRVGLEPTLSEEVPELYQLSITLSMLRGWTRTSDPE